MANQQQSSTTDAAALEYAGDTYLNVYLDDTKKLRIVRKTWEMPPGRTTYITRAKKGNSSRWLPGTPQKGFDTLEEALDALIKHGYGEKEELRKIYLAEEAAAEAKLRTGSPKRPSTGPHSPSKKGKQGAQPGGQVDPSSSGTADSKALHRLSNNNSSLSAFDQGQGAQTTTYRHQEQSRQQQQRQQQQPEQALIRPATAAGFVPPAVTQAGLPSQQQPSQQQQHLYELLQGNPAGMPWQPALNQRAAAGPNPSPGSFTGFIPAAGPQQLLLLQAGVPGMPPQPGPGWQAAARPYLPQMTEGMGMVRQQQQQHNHSHYQAQLPQQQLPGPGSVLPAPVSSPAPGLCLPGVTQAPGLQQQLTPYSAGLQLPYGTPPAAGSFGGFGGAGFTPAGLPHGLGPSLAQALQALPQASQGIIQVNNVIQVANLQVVTPPVAGVGLQPMMPGLSGTTPQFSTTPVRPGQTSMAPSPAMNRELTAAAAHGTYPGSVPSHADGEAAAAAAAGVGSLSLDLGKAERQGLPAAGRSAAGLIRHIQGKLPPHSLEAMHTWLNKVLCKASVLHWSFSPQHQRKIISAQALFLSGQVQYLSLLGDANLQLGRDFVPLALQVMPGLLGAGSFGAVSGASLADSSKLKPACLQGTFVLKCQLAGSVKARTFSKLPGCLKKARPDYTGLMTGFLCKHLLTVHSFGLAAARVDISDPEAAALAAAAAAASTCGPPPMPFNPLFGDLSDNKAVGEAGSSSAGDPYVVLFACTLLEQMSFDGNELLPRHPFGTSPHEAALVTFMVAKALKVMHKQGFIHKDVKPNNIFFKPAFAPKPGELPRELASLRPYELLAVLADTGHSVRKGLSATDTRLSGTPGLWAPEVQAGREAYARQDEAALRQLELTVKLDIWLLGVVWVLFRFGTTVLSWIPEHRSSVLVEKLLERGRQRSELWGGVLTPQEQNGRPCDEL